MFSTAARAAPEWTMPGIPLCGERVTLSTLPPPCGMKALVAAGLYVEPTSATAAAAFEMLCESGEIGDGEVTVAILTGSGLKASAFMTETFAG